MRFRFGRPDLVRYADRFEGPPAGDDAPLTVTWLGVSTLLIDDGSSALLTDGYFSRPSLPRVALRRLTPSAARIDGSLARAGIRRLAAVVVSHTHLDHALDSAVVADRTGAVLVGGESAANIGRGHGLAEDRLVVATPGVPMKLGTYAVTLVESQHCPPDRCPGVISTPVRPPARASAYRCGETWSMLLAHLPSQRRLLIQGSAGFAAGALAGHRAEVAYLGVGQLGLMPHRYLAEYWSQTVRAVGASKVVLVHWDDFFRPLSAPVRALPYAVDDLDATMRTLAKLAETDQVELQLPRLWRREDPWPVEQPV